MIKRVTALLLCLVFSVSAVSDNAEAGQGSAGNSER